MSSGAPPCPSACRSTTQRWRAAHTVKSIASRPGARSGRPAGGRAVAFLIPYPECSQDGCGQWEKGNPKARCAARGRGSPRLFLDLANGRPYFMRWGPCGPPRSIARRVNPHHYSRKARAGPAEISGWIDRCPPLFGPSSIYRSGIRHHCSFMLSGAFPLVAWQLHWCFTAALRMVIKASRFQPRSTSFGERSTDNTRVRFWTKGVRFWTKGVRFWTNGVRFWTKGV